jgi:hypothetical protein
MMLSARPELGSKVQKKDGHNRKILDRNFAGSAAQRSEFLSSSSVTQAARRSISKNEARLPTAEMDIGDLSTEQRMWSKWEKK